MGRLRLLLQLLHDRCCSHVGRPAKGGATMDVRLGEADMEKGSTWRD